MRHERSSYLTAFKGVGLTSTSRRAGLHFDISANFSACPHVGNFLPIFKPCVASFCCCSPWQEGCKQKRAKTKRRACKNVLCCVLLRSNFHFTSLLIRLWFHSKIKHWEKQLFFFFFSLSFIKKYCLLEENNNNNNKIPLDSFWTALLILELEWFTMHEVLCALHFSMLWASACSCAKSQQK